MRIFGRRYKLTGKVWEYEHSNGRWVDITYRQPPKSGGCYRCEWYNEEIGERDYGVNVRWLWQAKRRMRRLMK